MVLRTYPPPPETAQADPAFREFRHGPFSVSESPIPEAAIQPLLSATDPVVAACELNGAIFVFTQDGAIWKMTSNPLTLTQIIFP